MATPLIDPTTLDVDGIKASLVAFLKSQTEFSDYNFDGAGLSVLMNILTANTHYYALYKSFIANEAFLDSAILRSSVISRANEKGYLAKGVTASSTNITAILSNATPGLPSVSVPLGSVFNGVVNNTNFNFVTVDHADLIPTGVSGQYSGAFTVREGSFITTTFDYTQGSRYILPNLNVDPTTIRVRVQVSRSNTSTQSYFMTSSIIDVTSTSLCYFITQDEQGAYELVFGNGVFGALLNSGNVIVVDYVVSKPAQGDGIAVLTPAAVIFNSGVLSLSMSPTSGASDQESTKSIKDNAKRHIAQQNRCVVETDYITEIRKNFPEFTDVVAWGGENNIPPVYGKTFLCVLSSNLMNQTIQKKNAIKTAIKAKNITAITPEVVDPQLTYLRLLASVKYDPALTLLSSNSIKSIVLNTISAYNTANLNKFSSNYVNSKLVTLITNSDPSIDSTKITVNVESTIYPDLINVSSYAASFSTPIVPGSISSDPFMKQNGVANVVYGLRDDSKGNVVVVAYPQTAGAITYVVPGNFGQVDYINGIVLIGGLLVQPTINKSGWSVTAEPQDVDIYTTGSHVVSINTTTSDANIIALKSGNQ